MSKQNASRAIAIVHANRQQHHIGKTIKTSIFGRMVEGKILKVHPFNVIDIQLSNGNCFRVSNISLTD